MADQLVKRFVAPTMTRALELVQREMGPEAVILSSQRTDKGIEIVTSMEPDLPTRGIDARREFGQKFDAELDSAMPSDMAWRSQAGIEEAAAKFGGTQERNGEDRANAISSGVRDPETLAREIEKAREKMFAAKRRAEASGNPQSDSPVERRKDPASWRYQSENRPQPQSFTPAENPFGATQSNASDTASDRAYIERLYTDIADMRMLLEQQMWQLSEQRQLSGAQMPQQVSMPGHFGVLAKHLERLGLTGELVEQLAAQVGHHSHSSAAWRECMANLARQIPVAETPILESAGIYAFLGQTGVGKTTTIGKLAAQYVLKHGAGKVALVTTDTYRVGAFDQLRTMGKILNVPVRVVDGDNSLLTVLSSLRQFPLILIDTAGFRLGDPLLKQQLEQLEMSSAIKRMLVVSCNSQIATIKASLHAHRGKRGLAGCILTKIDESVSIGEALSLVVKEKLPVAYTTDGQNIPNDIAQATGHGIVAKAVSLLKSQSSDLSAVPG